MIIIAADVTRQEIQNWGYFSKTTLTTLSLLNRSGE
jgi:hypothetical protein